MAKSASKSKRATARDIQKALANINDDHLQCRDIGHNWRQYAVRKARGGYERSMFCRQCKTARHQFISSKGDVLTNSYSYAEGYQLRGVGRLAAEGKGIIRLTTIERSLDDTHADIMLEEPNAPIGSKAYRLKHGLVETELV